jgi:biotin-dependent carboxylase-like uncharacterized protein
VIEVVGTGPLATLQDLGRPGFAHLGVPHSGAADAAALRLANRLVGNPEGAACLELTLAGATLRPHGPVWISVTGAPAPIRVAGRVHGMNAPLHVPGGGALVELGVAAAGLRTYVAVRGGLDGELVLGSRSTDLLSGLGPRPLRPGDILTLAHEPVTDILLDQAAVPPPDPEPVLRLRPGPREDWFAPEALELLTTTPYQVTQDANRVGVRLEGGPLPRARDGELPSEGVVTGALQVPPDGRPILFLTDHPTTGGYPVIAVLTDRDISKAAQLRPGQPVRFRLA